MHRGASYNDVVKWTIIECTTVHPYWLGGYNYKITLYSSFLFMVDVSIIIVNYNTSRLVNDALESIFGRTEGVTFEVIVVDNNTENLSESIRFAPRQDVKLLQLKENVGFGRANNAGLKLASGRNIFFLNPDTVLLNNAVKILSDYIDSHQDCGACGGNLFNEDLRPARSFRKIFPSAVSLVMETFTGHFYEKLRSGGNPVFNVSGKPQDVAYIVGADIMFRHADLDRLGAFDPAFFMYYEEIELCHRFRKAGYRIVSVPQAEIQHLAGKAGMMGEGKATLHYQSSQTFFRLTRPASAYRRYNRILGMVIPLRLLIGKILGSANMQTFWGTWNRLHREREKKI